MGTLFRSFWPERGREKQTHISPFGQLIPSPTQSGEANFLEICKNVLNSRKIWTLDSVLLLEVDR
jgi:hypothetical protein